MARQHYGVTPWGKWFIEVLNSYEMDSRLDRGKTYANTGRVLSLTIKDNRVLAKVEGHYQPFYRVEIVFPELKEKQRVLELIEQDPALLAHIQAGELPEALLIKLKQEGVNLIPPRWQDMKRTCNCPDWGDPCKHQAALYFILAREIDADPRILFRLRGIDLSALAKQFGSSLDRNILPPFTVSADPAPRKPPAEMPEIPPIPQCTELILSLLPDAPSFCERDFTLVLAEFYHQAARFTFWETTAPEDPNLEHTASRSRWTIDCANPGPGAIPTLVQEPVEGAPLRHTFYEVFQQFRFFASDDGVPSYTFLFHLCKFLNLLCAAGAFIPAVFIPQTSGKTKSPEELRIIWKPYHQLPLIDEALHALAALEDQLLQMKPGSKTEPPLFAGGRSVVDLLASAFLGEWVKRNYFSPQKGSARYRELAALFFQDQPIPIGSPGLRSLPLAMDRWLSVLSLDFSAWKYRLTLKTRASKTAESLDFKLSMEVLLETEAGIEPVPLKNAVKKTGNIEVLKTPRALSHYLPTLETLMSAAAVPLAEEQLVHFLDNAAPLLSRLGMEVIFPKNLHRELKPQAVLQTSAQKAGSLISYLNLDTLLDWKWQIALGDAILTLEEFKELVKQKRAVVKFKDKFIRLDPEEVAQLFKDIQTRAVPGVNDFLKTHFAGNSRLSFDAERIMEKLLTERNFPVPENLRADLRAYQNRGYNWICSLLFAGFGCILADDMGLGKTIQAITALLRLREEGLLTDPCLIVAPASLLENWERELGRFAPSVSVARYHGARRRIDEAHEVFLTTYQTVVRDSPALQGQVFSLLIVDEAHLMKNAETKGAKTVKQLRSQYRLALSGTPVENRLEDLRSLFDFILPGYLGTAAHFKEQYRIPIEIRRQKEAADTLRKITAPFLLRRLKTDRQIIADLPEKIVINEYALLVKEQAALYESIVAETLEKSAALEDPQQRSALVLGLLTALKQICDHPRVYDKESALTSKLSGKAQLLLTLLEGILANREKVLIFSQYVETLDCLQGIIQKELQEPVLLYHGGISQKKRTGIIDRFQTEPACRILLVSLKAGGLGLNLTAANQVIHYDLWYNPAVENQATDRAFRIGQRRNVFVHRFITKNSFEEKIDAMLTSKQELAEMTISSGESWLARMSHEELKSLFDR